jgi:cytochrome c5
MAESNAKMTKATPQEVLVSVVLGLLAPLIAIVLILFLVNSIQQKQIDADTPEIAEKTVLKNIAPVAKLAALDANAPRVEKSGEEVFNAVCTSCHTPGALGAPKYGNKGDWAARIAQGYDTLINHALNGIRAMPPRGGDPDLSDTEIARAVAYMADSAGAKFKAPEAAVPAAAPAPAAATTGAAPAAAPAPAAAKAADGKGVYEASCVACHGSGALGAPKLGDKAAWAPRIKTGKDALYTSALKGKNMMPAKGGNAGLPDADVKAAVDYMISQSK